MPRLIDTTKICSTLSSNHMRMDITIVLHDSWPISSILYLHQWIFWIFVALSHIYGPKLLSIVFFSWSSTAIVCSFLLHFGVFCCQLCGRKHTGAKSPLQKIMTVVFMLQDVSTRLYKKKTIGFCINPAELLQLLNQLHHHLICRIIIS